MTVAELIAALQELPPGLEVFATHAKIYGYSTDHPATGPVVFTRGEMVNDRLREQQAVKII